MTSTMIFKNLRGRRLHIPDTEWIDGTFAKELRVNYFHMSQNAFSEALGISKKTVEAWECGRNKPDSSTRKLLYLLKEHPELMKDLYSFENETEYMKFSGIFNKAFPQITKVQGMELSLNTFGNIGTGRMLEYGA